MPANQDNSSILVISDMHIPYHHPDLLKFLKAVKKKYSPTRVVCIGDEVDKHAMSFHASDPDLPSAGDELKQAIEDLKPIYKLFPNVDLVDSNHGSMHYRKGKYHGIARKYLCSYNDILEAPKGWKWHTDLTITLPNKQECFFTHGLKKNGSLLARSQGMNTVQGHYHSVFQVQYHSSPAQLFWSMQVGCLIDDDSMAFHYNKVTPERPIIGLGMIVNSQPLLVPMVLKSGGEWTGKLA